MNMIPAISPDVFRDQPDYRRLKWGVSVILYALASMVTAALVGAIIGSLGSLAPVGRTASAVIFAMCALFYGMHELGLIRIRHPQLGWQAPSGWRRFHPWVTAICYGAYLGLGVLHYTFVTSFLVVVVWAFLVGDPLLSAATMAAFGLGQALPIFVISGRVSSPDRAYEIGCGVHQYREAVRLINGITMVAASVLVGLMKLFTL
jgi:cytochrome c biogenesis protein CcdA